MGKIVKYCAACDESFAEKFSFCPTCGKEMTAFEMNPLNTEMKPPNAKTKPIAAAQTVEFKNETANEDLLEIPAPAVTAVKVPVKAETPAKFETLNPVTGTATFSSFSDDAATQNNYDVLKSKEVKAFDETPVAPVIEPAPTVQSFTPAIEAVNGHSNGNAKTNDNFQTPKTYLPSAELSNDRSFNVTVIEEKGVKRRNYLLFGTMVLAVMALLGGTVYSLFNHDLLVGAIDSNNELYVGVVEDVPVEVEKQEKKNKDDGGGGGGGGKDEDKPASKGRLVTQSEKPITPPSVNIPQLKNPELPVFMSTQGKIKRDRTEERPGIPSSLSSDLSNGGGSGGGIGNGNGTGIGNGRGTGEGNGDGSGSGNGKGNGNGNGRGDGDNNTPKQPPPPPSAPVNAVTEPLKILSKPRATYTDAARQNNVTGVVRVRVTFSASGAVTGITPVSGLPYGLTEQAIAAARQIRFEPMKKNGVAVATTKVLEYSFTIY